MKAASSTRNTSSSMQGIALKPQRRFSWDSQPVALSAMITSLTPCHKKSSMNSQHFSTTQHNEQKTATSITLRLFSRYPLLKIELVFAKLRKNCPLLAQPLPLARKMTKGEFHTWVQSLTADQVLAVGPQETPLLDIAFPRVREIKQRHLS